MMWPDWTGETVVIVASGPSAANEPLAIGRDKVRFLAVKDGWRLCPWADALYGCDHHWWEAHRGLIDWPALRICYDPRTVEKWRGLDWLKADIKRGHENFLFHHVGEVGWGGNSGFHAMNLALQFGASRLVLVGFDMRVDHGRHFFGAHKYSNAPSEANCRKWVEVIDRQAPAIAARGARVVNCSPLSALTAYPKLPFAEAIA
jgi:hypothetical protein